jgi:hypothetical protein
MWFQAIPREAWIGGCGGDVRLLEIEGRAVVGMVDIPNVNRPVYADGILKDFGVDILECRRDPGFVVAHNDIVRFGEEK